jgi:meiotic recombination protein SPO11
MENNPIARTQQAERVPDHILSAVALPRASAPASSIVILPQRESQISQAGAVISKIEAIFESILDNLENGASNLSIPYRCRTGAARSRHLPGDNEPATLEARPEGAVLFPGRTPHEAKKFGRKSWHLSVISVLFLIFSSLPSSVSLLRILDVSRKAIAAGTVITKRSHFPFYLFSSYRRLIVSRNIFYQNTDLFRHQRVVDNLVDDLAFSLGVGRDDLNIVSSSQASFNLSSDTDEAPGCSRERTHCRSCHADYAQQFGHTLWSLPRKCRCRLSCRRLTAFAEAYRELSYRHRN